VDCIAGLWKAEFNIGNFQFIVIEDSGPHHIIAVKFVKQSFAWFERILRGDNKPHFIQIGALGHEVGNDHMPHVNGVEGAEEETDFQDLK
jgi:hypothetical protein